jgi:AcrR family transcriptional regulator
MAEQEVDHVEDHAAPSQRTSAKILSKPPRTTSEKGSRGASRAQQIIKTAEQMFYERGYAETSMDDIAQAVGILKGSLYYYINSKDDLLFHIASAVHEAVEVATEEALGRTDLSPLERILHFVRSQIRYNTENVTQMAVYHHEWRRLEGDRLDSIRSRRHGHATAMLDLLDQAKAAGEIDPDMNTQLALNNIFAITIWPYTWYRPGNAISPDELIEFCANMIYNGLALRTPDAPAPA